MNVELRLSNVGVLAMKCWQKIPEHFHHVKLDEFTVMPNHLHGILIFNRNSRDTACRVPTAEKFSIPVAGSLPTIIRSFKSAVTKRVNILHQTPGAIFWQRRYYEHVVRNEKELNSIREYIVNNQARWAFDRENPGLYKKNNNYQDEVLLSRYSPKFR
ncbi:transposase [Gemmatimonadota bacterium]